MTLFPPMVVQASDVYLDLPLAVAATWSLVLFLEGSRGKASVAACLAAAVKPTAIILVPVMGMILIAQRDRSMRARLLLFPPVLVAGGPGARRWCPPIRSDRPAGDRGFSDGSDAGVSRGRCPSPSLWWAP